MKKTIILPILAVIVLILQLTLGINIGDDVVNEIADYIVAGVSLFGVVYGIFKNYKKEKEDGQK